MRVVHLGELVGDPACAVDVPPRWPSTSKPPGTSPCSPASSACGASSIPSSCSVYGATESVVDEESDLNPVSLYAETKVHVEEEMAVAATDGLETVVLRLATVYGLSPRPRFDLVVNLFAARGLVDRHIAVHGGDQWRPFIHVADVADVMAICLEAPRRLSPGRTFNVGSDDQNHTIGQVADMVQSQVPDAELTIEPIDDHRNYRVSFESHPPDARLQAAARSR